MSAPFWYAVVPAIFMMLPWTLNNSLKNDRMWGTQWHNQEKFTHKNMLHSERLALSHFPHFPNITLCQQPPSPLANVDFDPLLLSQAGQGTGQGLWNLPWNRKLWARLNSPIHWLLCYKWFRVWDSAEGSTELSGCGEPACAAEKPNAMAEYAQRKAYYTCTKLVRNI